jgi:hypothetical protein
MRAGDYQSAGAIHGKIRDEDTKKGKRAKPKG